MLEILSVATKLRTKLLGLFSFGDVTVCMVVVSADAVDFVAAAAAAPGSGAGCDF